jgi:hypothetical protein
VVSGCRMAAALRGASGKKWLGWTDQRWTEIEFPPARVSGSDRFDEPNGRLSVSHHAKME